MRSLYAPAETVPEVYPMSRVMVLMSWFQLETSQALSLNDGTCSYKEKNFWPAQITATLDILSNTTLSLYILTVVIFHR